MESWLQWARGPVFHFSFAFMLLGLLRHVVLTCWEINRTLRRAGDKSLPYAQVAVTTLKWMFPLGKMKNQFTFSLTSILFHIGVLVVPLFLGGHIVLWARGSGVSWPAISNQVADVLTVLVILTGIALVLQRALARATRSLSRFQDYALPFIIAFVFLTGFMVMHPAANPFSFEATLFLHVMSGNLVFILMPLTKLSHAVLAPSVQLVSELGWRWPSDGGSRVAVSLGKEGEPV